MYSQISLKRNLFTWYKVTKKTVHQNLKKNKTVAGNGCSNKMDLENFLKDADLAHLFEHIKWGKRGGGGRGSSGCLWKTNGSSSIRAPSVKQFFKY